MSVILAAFYPLPIPVVAFNLLTICFWWWVCFRGGDEVWCRQTKAFWRGWAYTWMTPRFCRAWMWLMLALTLVADVVFLVFARP